MSSARYGIDLKRPAEPTSRLEGFEPVQQIFLLPRAVPSWLLIWGERKDCSTVRLRLRCVRLHGCILESVLVSLQD